MDDQAPPPTTDPIELDATSSGLRSIAKDVVGSREDARAAWEALRAAAKDEADSVPIAPVKEAEAS